MNWLVIVQWPLERVQCEVRENGYKGPYVLMHPLVGIQTKFCGHLQKVTYMMNGSVIGCARELVQEVELED